LPRGDDGVSVKRFTLKSGQKLHYLDSGQGPALVLLHGWAMSSAIFSPAIHPLAQNFRLLVPDLRGHGESDPGDHYTLDYFAADVLQWLESLNLESFFLLGWSLGGQVAIRLAANGTLPIKRLILVSSTPKFCHGADWESGLPQSQVRAMERQFHRDPRTTFNDFAAMLFAGEKSGKGLAEKVRARLILPETKAGLAALATLKNGDLRGELKNIRMPTLIHHGRADTVIPVSAGLFLAEQIPNTEASLWDHVGHVPFLSYPERSQSLWKEFLLES